MSAAVREYRDLEAQWASFLPQSLRRKRDAGDEQVLSALKLRELGLIGPHDVADDDEQRQQQQQQLYEDDMYYNNNNEVLKNLYATPRTAVDRLLRDSYRLNSTDNADIIHVPQYLQHEHQQQQHDKRVVEYARTYNQWHLQVIVSAENGGNVFTKSVLQLCKDLVTEIKAVSRYNVYMGNRTPIFDFFC